MIRSLLTGAALASTVLVAASLPASAKSHPKDSAPVAAPTAKPSPAQILLWNRANGRHSSKAVKTAAAEHKKPGLEATPADAARLAEARANQARKKTASAAPAKAAPKTAKRTTREGRSVAAAATTKAKPRSSLQALVAKYAAAEGIPFSLAHGVVMVESRYNPRATGKGGYIGLMQLSYRTAKGMGFSGSRAALYEPETNIKYGVKYLAGAYRQAGGNMCVTVSKYQGGHGVHGVTKAGAAYCGRVKHFIAAMPNEDRKTADKKMAAL